MLTECAIQTNLIKHRFGLVWFDLIQTFDWFDSKFDSSRIGVSRLDKCVCTLNDAIPPSINILGTSIMSYIIVFVLVMQVDGVEAGKKF